MRRTHIHVFALTLLLSAAVGVTAQTTISECLALISNLRAEVQDSSEFVLVGQNAERDRANLVMKLDAAVLKLQQAKFCDAIAKLHDFNAKVNQLQAAGKIDPASPVTAAQLIGESGEAIQCLRSLANQAGVACP